VYRRNSVNTLITVDASGDVPVLVFVKNTSCRWPSGQILSFQDAQLQALSVANRRMLDEEMKEMYDFPASKKQLKFKNKNCCS